MITSRVSLAVLLLVGFGGSASAFELSSSSVADGKWDQKFLAKEYGGQNVSPALSWKDPPAGVAEQWGRRWITIDSSRVALALARTRVMGARYPYYVLADSKEGRLKEAKLTGRPPVALVPDVGASVLVLDVGRAWRHPGCSVAGHGQDRL